MRVFFPFSFSRLALAWQYLQPAALVPINSSHKSQLFAGCIGWFAARSKPIFG
jgi:hypothetical protein